MNADIIKTQNVHKMKYDLRGFRRSHEVTFMWKINFFLDTFLVKNLILRKILKFDLNKITKIISLKFL